MNKKKILFIVNPKAGAGKKLDFQKIISQEINTDKYSFEIKFTQGPKHATELSKQAVKDGFSYCFAVGGDGTVNEVADGLKFTNTCLGVLPFGSGNGLARHLQIPMQINKALQLINNGKVLRIDTMLVNNRFSLNVSGIGFDAHVASLFGKNGNRGLVSYAKIVFSEFKKYREQEIDINYDGYLLSSKIFVAAFANSSQFGNNAFIAPKASVVDEQIDMVLLRKMSIPEALFLAPKLFFKSIDTSDYVQIIKAKKINITTQHEIALHIDGESAGNAKTFEIEVVPESLNVLVSAVTYR
jgi:YegS/Rv2252/BmrU family lipid kinase